MATRIGFIGTGNMGSAMIKGLAGNPELEIHGFDLYAPKLQELADESGMIAAKGEADLAEKCDYVILAVKPQYVESVVEKIIDKLDEKTVLISIAAGIVTKSLKDFSENRCPVVRVMPNTPAMVNEGVFAVCLEDTTLNQDQKNFMSLVFEPLGQVHVLEEKYFDAFTALAGSGPAYVFYFMEALMEAGVKMGFTRAQATEMVNQLLVGSAKMAAESGIHISQLREMVSSPAGTTIMATAHFDRMAVRSSIMDGVEESFARSVELGQD